MARGSAVDESRVRTAKILVTPHPGYFDYEQLQKQGTLTTNSSKKKTNRLPICCQERIKYRNTSETTRSQLWTTMVPHCVVMATGKGNLAFASVA